MADITATVWRALRTVEDPEAGVNIVDLGLVDVAEVTADGSARVTLVPTFSGCPARAYFIRAVKDALEGIPGIRVADVEWSPERVWTPDRMTEEGREALKDVGIGLSSAAAPECPYCGNSNVRRENEFGSAVCKSLYYCPKCRNPFESLKSGRLKRLPFTASEE